MKIFDRYSIVSDLTKIDKFHRNSIISGLNPGKLSITHCDMPHNYQTTHSHIDASQSDRA